MGLLDSLNDLAKKSEDIMNSGTKIIDSASKIVQDFSTIAASVKSEVPAKVSSSQPAKLPQSNVVGGEVIKTTDKCQVASVWEKIGCSRKTEEFITMSLADGIIDAKERSILLRRVTEDGVDPQEFDFVMTKALETYHNNAKNVIKELTNLFRMAGEMSASKIQTNQASLTAALPSVLGKVKNQYIVGTVSAVAAAETLSNIITTFIKEPSKLNTFKAEIIRMIDIPLFPEVLVDFFGYASSQIIEEKQRNRGKGVLTEWSETLFGKDIDLVPIWQEKMTQVMTKTVARYGNSLEIMSMVSKWRISPLKKLMKITNANSIEQFPMPGNASDFIQLLEYTYQKLTSIKCENKEAYSHLYQRLISESNRFINLTPKVQIAVEKCRIKPIISLMSNCEDPVFMIQFKAPSNLSDLLEILNFLGKRKDLKKHHQRIYNDGIEYFKNDIDALKKISAFKPKNILGF